MYLLNTVEASKRTTMAGTFSEILSTALEQPMPMMRLMLLRWIGARLNSAGHVISHATVYAIEAL